MLTNTIPKITVNAIKSYKSQFYQKSIVLRTDFSLYRKEFKLWHPRYFDIKRRTEYQKNVRDYKKLTFNTQDPLHFDYDQEHINGGFKLLLDNIKKDRNETTTYSIYRIIYILFHMAKNDIYDTEFFDELESQITPVLANSSFIQTRLIYGVLYSYYKFNRGKAENILFFENSLEEDPTVLHCEMSVKLFELAHDASIMDRDRLDLFIMNFFKPNFLSNWDKEIKYKQRLIADLFRIFQKVNYLDEEVWDKLIQTSVGLKRVDNMENYDIMLKGLIWYNENPKSTKFQKIKKELDLFKDKIRKNENRLWKYDPEKASWRTYEDLLRRREEIDESYVYAFIAGDVTVGDKKEIVEKKEFNLEEIKKLIAEKLKEKVGLIKIKNDMKDINIPQELVDEALVLLTKENQAKNVESLRKKGLFVPELSPKQYTDLKNLQRKNPKVAKKEEPKRKK